MLLRVFSKLDRYFLEKGDNYRKPLIWTMFITLYDHIWISLNLKSILLKNVYWPLTIIFSDQKLHSKIYLMCKILPRPCYIFPYLKTKLVNVISISGLYFSISWSTLTQTFPKRERICKRTFLECLLPQSLQYLGFFFLPWMENIIIRSIFYWYVFGVFLLFFCCKMPNDNHVCSVSLTII